MIMPPARNPWKSALCGRCGRCGRYLAGCCYDRLSSDPPATSTRAGPFKAALNACLAEEQVLTAPVGPKEALRALKTACTLIDPRPTGPQVADRGANLLLPAPCINVLRGCRVLAGAHLNTDAQHVVAHPHELRFREAVQLYRSCSTSNTTTTTQRRLPPSVISLTYYPSHVPHEAW